MTITGSIIISCWIILSIIWIIFMFYQKKVIIRSSLFNRIIHIIFVIIPLTLLVKYDFFYPLSIVILRQSLAIDILSIILCILGLIILIWSRLVIAKNWSGNVVIKKDHELIDKGPYSLVRHPIYTGFLTIYFGTTLAIGRLSAFIGLLIFLIGFIIKINQEEILLTKHFGNKYIEYKKRVKSLIPYIF